MMHIMKNSDETYLKITDIILFEMNVLQTKYNWNKFSFNNIDKTFILFTKGCASRMK